MTRFNSYLALGLAALLAISPLATLQAADSASLGGTFIADGVGARPIGMGGAFVAVASDANATYINPAGMAFFNAERKYATFTHTNLFDVPGLSRDFLAYSQGNISNFGALGISWNRFSADLDGPKWTEDAFMYSGAAVLTKGDEYPKYAVGWNLKYFSVKSGLNDASDGTSVGGGGASGYGVDLSMLVKARKSLALGIMIKDVYSALSWDTGTLEVVPTTGAVGLGYHFTEKTILAVEGRGTQTSAGFEIESWHLGAEHWIFKGEKEVWGAISNIGIRAGVSQVINNGDDGTISVGASVQADRWQIDYSYRFGISSADSLGETHRYGVSLVF